MSEVTIGYPRSPLNGPSLSTGPKPGERIAPIAGEAPVGSGSAPQFALFAPESPSIIELVKKFEGLLDPEVRPPLSRWNLARPARWLCGLCRKGSGGHLGVSGAACLVLAPCQFFDL